MEKMTWAFWKIVTMDQVTPGIRECQKCSEHKGGLRSKLDYVCIDYSTFQVEIRRERVLFGWDGMEGLLAY